MSENVENGQRLIEEVQILHEKQTLQQELMEIVFKQGSMHDLAQKTAMALAQSFMVIKIDGTVLSKITYAHEKKKAYCAKINQSKDGFQDRIDDLKRLANIHTIQTGDMVWGYLYFPETDGTETEIEHLINGCKLAFATMFFQRYIVWKDQSVFENVIITELLSGNVLSSIEIQEKMGQFQLSQKFPLYVVVLKALFPNVHIMRTVFEKIVRNSQEDRTNETGLFEFRNMLHALVNDEMVFLISKYMDVSKFCQCLMKFVKRELSSEILVGIGISNLVYHIEEIRSAKANADKVVAMGKLVAKKDYIEWYKNDSPLMVLQNVKDPSALYEYIENKFGKLIAYDRENDSNLMETFCQLMENGLNIRKTAEVSFLHYNTLRYRISVMKKLGVPIELEPGISEWAFAYHVYMWTKAQDGSHR